MALAQKSMVDHLLADGRDAAFKAVVEEFGERRVVDCFLSMTLNIDRYPLPNGAKPKLQPVP